VQPLPSELSRLAVGAALARARVMDDVDATDRVVVIVHTTSPEDDRDDDPTTPVLLDDHTTRQRCEFEEDTVEEYFV
jgi:hypothetical protein